MKKNTKIETLEIKAIICLITGFTDSNCQNLHPNEQLLL